MRDDQHGRGLRIYRNCSERMPALLTSLVDSVQADQPVLVFKNQRRQLESDPAMLALVLCVLSFIPFVAHNVYTTYTISGA